MLKRVAALIFVSTIRNYFFAAADLDQDPLPLGRDNLFQCRSGTLYVLNRCNMCQCAAEELFPCTLVNCDGQDYYAAKNCKIGRKWKEFCNDCKCVTEYGTVCTALECPAPKPVNPDGDYDYPLGPDPHSVPDFRPDVHLDSDYGSNEEYEDNN